MNTFVPPQGCHPGFCSNYGKQNGEGIAIHNKKSNRLRCKICGITWSAHSNEFRYGLRTEPMKICRAVDMLKAGVSVRTTARLVKVSPTTIMRWKKKLPV